MTALPPSRADIDQEAIVHRALICCGSLFVTGLHLHDLLTAHELAHSRWRNRFTQQVDTFTNSTVKTGKDEESTGSSQEDTV